MLENRNEPRWRLHCIEAWVFVYDESEDLRWDAGLNASGVATSGDAPWVRYYHRSGFKFGYFRAALTPAATAAYEYILLVDADCTFDTFGVGDFLGVLRRHELRIAQPAVLPRAGGRPAAARANRAPGGLKWCSFYTREPCASHARFVTPAQATRASIQRVSPRALGRPRRAQTALRKGSNGAHLHARALSEGLGVR